MWIALRFGARESEAVWQVTAHGFPELLLFVLGHDFEFIVVRLISCIMAIDFIFVCSLPPSIVCSAAASSEAVSSSSTLEAITMSAKMDGWIGVHITFLPRFPIVSSGRSRRASRRSRVVIDLLLFRTAHLITGVQKWGERQVSRVLDRGSQSGSCATGPGSINTNG